MICSHPAPLHPHTQIGGEKEHPFVDRDIVEARGGLVVSLPLLEGFSTTGVIQRIREGA